MIHAQSAAAVAGSGAAPGPVFEPDPNSVDFDGITEFMADTTNKTVGIADVWTLAGWEKSSIASAGAILNIQPSSGNTAQNRIRIDSNQQDLRIRVNNSAGPLFKNFRGNTNGLGATGTWFHWAISWDGPGNTMSLFVDAAVQTVDKLTDIVGNQIDGARSVYIARDNQAATLGTLLQNQVAAWNVDVDAVRARPVRAAGRPEIMGEQSS